MLEPGLKPSAGPSRGRKGFDVYACLALTLLSLLVYNANRRVITAGDNYSTRYLPFAILGYGTLYLDPVQRVVTQGTSDYYWMLTRGNGHVVSGYPVVTPLLISPLYIPAVAWLHVRGWTDERVDWLARLMEKFSASLIASLSVALIYLLLRRRVEVRTALLLAVAYGFGTNTWMTGSQGLWQHGMGELLLVIALLLVTGPCTAMRALAAGAVCALISFNRPPDAILAAAVGVYSFRWAGRGILLVAAGALVTAAPLLAYNIGMMGNIAGGYGTMASARFFSSSMPLGVAGLLTSLGRGLFVFTPFLLALPLCARRIFASRDTRPLSILICAAFVLQLLLYAKTDWRAGASWGPRFLTDVLPLLVWLLAPVVAGMGRAGRAAFVAAVCASIAIQAAGAFWYTGESDRELHVLSGGPGVMNAAWSLRNTPFILELRHPVAQPNLLLDVAGRIERVTAGGRETGEAPAGARIVVEGWTLADNLSPVEVEVRIVPVRNVNWMKAGQYPVNGITAFQPRPDVGAAMHTDAPAGWRTEFATDSLQPGDYMIEVFVDGGKGELRPVGHQPFKVLPADGKMAGNPNDN